MKISKMEIKGFRSLKNISFAHSNLNVVIGPNGTGNSILLRVLELIAVSAPGGGWLLNEKVWASLESEALEKYR
jgi:predicted ATPase